MTKAEKSRASFILYRFLWNSLDVVFPPQCAGCGKMGYRFCQKCTQEIQVLQGKTIPQCCQVQDNSNVCRQCRINPPLFDAIQSYALYTGSIRKAILRIKYHHDLGLAEELSRNLTDMFQKHLKWQIDTLITVPLRPDRLFERGYNQTNSLAFPIALALGLLFRSSTLARIRQTASQVGLSRKARIENVKGAFQVNHHSVAGQRILIIDDVTTTGSTISECATTLKRAGAAKVYGLTLAKTPSPREMTEPFNENLICG